MQSGGETGIILDHADDLELPHEIAAGRFNELRSLEYLAQGLWFLYVQVKNMEDEVTKRLDKNRRCFLYGNAPELSGVPMGLVACAFHWYATSACNYVRLVGWLVSGGDSAHAIRYVSRVIPEVKIWRDKVGAHFARVNPSKQDCPADLAFSVMFPVGFEDDAFYAASLQLGMGQGGQISTSRGDMRWSLTHTHLDLSNRYWPATVAN